MLHTMMLSANCSSTKPSRMPGLPNMRRHQRQLAEMDRVVLQLSETLFHLAREQSVREQCRNGHNKTELSGDEGLGYAGGDCIGVTGTEQGHQPEGGDHAGHGTEQTEQWRHRCGDGDGSQPALQGMA